MKFMVRAFVFLVRGIVGLIAIYFTNIFAAAYNIEIGINFVTGTVVGLLGVPGYLLLYLLGIVDQIIFI